MPQQAAFSPPLRQCSSLATLCQSVLEKSLLQAFCLLGKLEAKSKSIRFMRENKVVSFLHQRERDMPLAQIQAYLSSIMPTSYGQGMVNNLMEALATPEFNKNALINNTEFKFRVLNTVVCTADMKEVLKIFLECMLLGFVTSLDFSGFYALGSCWVDQTRRMLFTWSKINGGGEYVMDIESGNVCMLQLESLWQGMMHEHQMAANTAAINSARCFHQLKRINIDHIASGELVWAIGCNCPLLQELSMYIDTFDKSIYSSHFEEELIEGLSALYGHEKFTQTSFRGKPVGCPKIQRIVMPSLHIQGKMEECAGKLLCYLPNLEELVNVGTTSSLDALFQEEDFNCKPLALTYLDDARRPESIEDVCKYYGIEIKKILPKITSVRMRKVEGGLKQLTNFPLLKQLEYMVIRESELEFGINLTQITHFKSNCRWDEKKLAAFSQRVPRLEMMLMSGSLHKHKNKKMKEFMSYPKLRVIKLCHLNHIEVIPLTNFLKSTKVLTHIIIEENEVLHKDKMYSLYEAINDKVIASVAPSLKKLVCFHAHIKEYHGFSKYAITEKSVHVLLANCPNLATVGNLFHWNIPYQDVLALKKQAKDKNWKISFTPSDEA